MSDDEYYDDEYADFHDMLYDADPDPDLADDLAEHAAHSPVYFDNPNEEARDYFSDWEYYSDDYFDDDPVLLSAMSKSQAEEKSTTRSGRQPTKRGRKRKLSEARDLPIPDTKEMRALRACMQGTVWKDQSPELVEDYKGGHSEPVALRLSTAIMRSAYSMKKGFGTGRSTKDESWANDLSLADMGLRTETSMDPQHGSGIVDDETVQEDDESVSEDNMMSDAVMMEGVDLQSSSIELKRSHGRSPKVGTANGGGQSSKILPGDSDNEVEQRRRKRRKVVASESSTESKTSFNTPETSLGSDVSETAMEIEPETLTVPLKRSRGRPKKETTAARQTSKKDIATPSTSAGSSHKRQSSRTRSSATASTASSRARNTTSPGVASTSSRTNNAATSKVVNPTRKTRSQHK